MNSIKEVAKVIKKAKSIAIFTHVSPDFDAFGSSFSLYYALKDLGKNVELFSKEKPISNQKLLFEDIINNNNVNESNFDLFICVDVSSLNRLGDYSNIFANKNNNTLVLDHHYTNENFWKYSYIDNKRSSCCEIIFETLTALKCKLNNNICSYLYAGLSSDTSSFQNSNTKAGSFVTASKLIELGADVNKINQILYQTKSLKEVSFKKYLWNNYKIYKDCAYCLVDYQSLTEMKGKKIDCDTFSHSLVSIEGVNRSFSLIEQEKGVFNLSMRAKAGYDVRIVAQNFGGGGHIGAAGAVFKEKNIQTAKKKILDIIFKSEN